MLSLQIIFDLGTQSPSQERQLTFFNFILPGLITEGLMIYAIIDIFMKRKSFKTIVFLLIFLGLFEILAIRWQVNYLLWNIGKEFISEIVPILTGEIMIISLFTRLILNFIELKRIMN